jgi:hypothetical protein
MIAYFRYTLDDFQEKKRLGVLDLGWLLFGLTHMEREVKLLTSLNSTCGHRPGIVVLQQTKYRPSRIGVRCWGLGRLFFGGRRSEGSDSVAFFHSLQ